MLNRWKFTLLLIALLALLLLHPFVNHHDPYGWMYRALFVLVLLEVFTILVRRRKSRIAAVVLGLPSVAAVFLHSTIEQNLPSLASISFHALPAIFLGYMIAVILRTVFQKPGIGADSVNGALAGYLLLGLLFAHLYSLAETFHPGSFVISPELGGLSGPEHNRHSLFSYFSLVTLTSVGYGDITPRHPVARNLACVEAIVGQFYVAVIVAQLIGMKVSLALGGAPAKSESIDGSDSI